MTSDEYDDPEPKYECVVCGKTAHNPKPIVLCEWQHTKEQTLGALKRLLK